MPRPDEMLNNLLARFLHKYVTSQWNYLNLSFNMKGFFKKSKILFLLNSDLVIIVFT